MQRILIAAIAAIGLAGSVQAATISGDTGGQWRSTNIGSSTNSCRFNTTHGSKTGVAWGSPKKSCPDLNDKGYDDSYIVLQDYDFSYDVTAPAKVQIGQVKWRNESTPSKTTPNFAAIADFFLNLTDPVSGTVFEGLAFNIDNTTNVGGGTNDSILAMTWANYGLDIPITVGDVTITGFTFELLSGDASLSQTVLPNGDIKFTWINKEHNTSKLGIFAHVQPAVVPIPATALLMLTGIGGLALLRRRMAV